MPQALKPHKITKVSAPKLRSRSSCELLSYESRAIARSSKARELSELRSSPYFVVTSECVIACTDNAIRFCTPTLRISFATCAFTVRSSIPS